MSRSLIKNLLYNASYQLLILFLPLATAPYLARVIGPNGVGMYSYVYSVALYFSYFTLLGLNNYGNRVIAGVQGDLPARSRAFCELYLMQALSFVLSAALYGAYVWGVAQEKTAALIMGLYVLSALLDINWFFYGMELFKITVLRSTIVKIVSVALIFLYVKTPADIYVYALIMAAGYLANQALIWIALGKYVRFTRVRLRDLQKHVKPNLYFFVSVMAVSIYKIMSKIMLVNMTDTAQLGFYENAEKIINVPIMLITSVGMVMLAHMSTGKMQAKGRLVGMIDRSMRHVLFFAIGSVGGLCAVGPAFSVFFYGPQFAQTGYVIQWLSVTIWAFAIGNVVRTQYLIPRQMDRVYLRSAILGAVVNVAANLVFIPPLGAAGAAIGTGLAELSVMAYQSWKVRGALRIGLYLRDTIAFSILGAGMILLYGALNLLENNLTGMGLRVLISGGFYAILSLAYIRRTARIEAPRR